MLKRDTPRYLWDEYYIERPTEYAVSEIPENRGKKINPIGDKTDYKNSKETN